MKKKSYRRDYIFPLVILAILSCIAYEGYIQQEEGSYLVFGRGI